MDSEEGEHYSEKVKCDSNLSVHYLSASTERKLHAILDRLRTNRPVGIYVYCEDCFRFRYAYTKTAYFLRTAKSPEWKYFQQLARGLNISHIAALSLSEPQRKESPNTKTMLSPSQRSDGGDYASEKSDEGPTPESSHLLQVPKSSTKKAGNLSSSSQENPFRLLSSSEEKSSGQEESGPPRVGATKLKPSLKPKSTPRPKLKSKSRPKPTEASYSPPSPPYAFSYESQSEVEDISLPSQKKKSPVGEGYEISERGGRRLRRSPSGIQSTGRSILEDPDITKLISELEPLNSTSYKMDLNRTQKDLIDIFLEDDEETETILKNEKKIMRFLKLNDEYFRLTPDDPVETLGPTTYSGMSIKNRIAELVKRLENSYIVLLHNVPETVRNERGRITKILQHILHQEINFSFKYERTGHKTKGVPPIIKVTLPDIHLAQRMLQRNSFDIPKFGNIKTSRCLTEIQKRQKGILRDELKRRRRAGQEVAIDIVYGEPTIIPK